jgi:cation transport regulator ChaB
MYYKQISELPKQIQESLPRNAQKEYLKVFNGAWEQYKDDQSIANNDERKSTAHQVAWESVKEGQK